MNKKTLIVLLLAVLLVVVLFVVSLLLGSRETRSGFKFDPQSPGLARIANWLSRPAKAENLTLRSGSTADCRLENNRITVQPGATCLYSMSSDKVWTRKLRLALLSVPDGLAGKVTVSLEQPEALKVEQTLEPGRTSEPFEIFGRKDQALATLTIQAPVSMLPEPPSYVIEVIEK